MKMRYTTRLLIGILCTAVFCTAVLAAETYKLKNDLEVRADQVRTLQITQYGMGGDQKLTIADKSVTAAVLEGLGNMEVRPWASDGAMKNGGQPLEYTITTEDNKVWRYRNADDSLTKPDGTTQAYEVIRDYTNGYMLFDDLISIPRLRAKLNDSDVKIYQESFSYNGNVKTTTAEFPVDMRFEDDTYLPVGGTNVCTLTFGIIKPESLTATLYPEAEEEKLGTGRKLPVERDKIKLPGEKGKYYLALDAGFAGGTVRYMLEFTVSDLPTFFDNISYGNDDNGVTVTRTDAGVTLAETGQNRKFVEFIRSLDLREAASGEAPALPVRNPFTLTFRHKGEQATFQFTGGGIVYTYQDGPKACVTPYPERIEALYTQLTDDVMDDGRLIDYSLRGFLSKEVALFCDQYGITSENVQKLVLYQEKTDDYTAWDVTDLVGKNADSPLCGLEDMVLAKPAAETDLYWPRRFFCSYELVMKDGTVYRTGEGLTVNGQPTEWVVVSAHIGMEDLAAGRQGVKTERETSLPVIRAIDDDGKITYVSKVQQ